MTRSRRKKTVREQIPREKGHARRQDIVKTKQVVKSESRSFSDSHPVWSFEHLDRDSRWTIDEEHAGDDYWPYIHKTLVSLSGKTWAEIMVKDKKQNHYVAARTLNPCAQERLDAMNFPIETTRLFAMHCSGRRVLYGLLEMPVLYLLWYDPDHGDNDTCVCRSRKKHT